MAKSCSIVNLTLEDQTRFKAVKATRATKTRKAVGIHAARQKEVRAMLRDAKEERALIVAEIVRNYPELVNSDGEFFEDLASEAEAKAAGQQSMFAGGSKTVLPELSRKSIKDPDEIEGEEAVDAAEVIAKKLVPKKVEPKAKVKPKSDAAKLKVEPKAEEAELHSIKRAPNYEELGYYVVTLKDGRVFNISWDRDTKGWSIADQKIVNHTSGIIAYSRTDAVTYILENAGDLTPSATVDINAKPKLKPKKRDPLSNKEQGAAGVAAKEQAGGTGKAATRNPLSRRTTGEGTGQQGTNPKAEISGKSEPAGREKPEPSEPGGKPDSGSEPRAAAKLAPELDDTPSKLEAGVEDAIDILATVDHNTREWKAAAAGLMRIALVRKQTGSKADKAAWDRASLIVANTGGDAEYLWGAGKATVNEVFADMASSTVRSAVRDGEGPRFSTHSRIWEFADEQGIFVALLSRLSMSEKGKAPVLPRIPSAAMLKNYPEVFKKVLQRATVEKRRAEASVAEERPVPVDMTEIALEEGAEARDGERDTVGIEDSDPTDYASEVEDITSDPRDYDINSMNSLVDLDNNPITAPMRLGAVKLFVGRFKDKLSKTLRLRFRTYKNVAELQHKDPDVYKAAQDAHEDNKVIPDNAAGVAFGRTVIIFSDNIANKHHLAFVLSHEVVGHFGLGGIMPKKEFRKLLEDVYESDPAIREVVDRKTGTEQVRYDTIEEALADRAADIDNSLILRIASIIKRFLNRLGFRFNDDMTRYFVHQSRRYVRQGIRGDASADGVRNVLLDMESHAINTRYSLGESSNPFYSSVVMGQKGLTDIDSGLGGMTDRIRRGLGAIVDTRNAKTPLEGVGVIYDNALESLQTMGHLAKKNAGMHRIYEFMKLEVQEVARFKRKYNDMTEFSHRAEGKYLKAVGIGRNKEAGPTKGALWEADRVMELWLIAKGDSATNALLKDSHALIIEGADGTPEINETVVKALKELGNMKKEELEAGVQVPKIDGKTGEQEIIDGTPQTELMKLEFDVISDEAWKVVTEIREVVDVADLDMYLNTVKGVIREQKASWEVIRKANIALTDADQSILEDIMQTYAKMYLVGSSIDQRSIKYDKPAVARAIQFLRDATRVLDSIHGKEKLDDWTTGSDKPRSAGTEAMRKNPNADMKRIISKLKALQNNKLGKGISGDAIYSAIAKMHMLSVDMERAELVAKNTILTAYVPLNRKGKFQVRVRAIVNKKTVELAAGLEDLMRVSRTDSLNYARSQTSDLNGEFKKIPPMDLMGAEGVIIENVTFEAIYDTSLEVPPLAGYVSYGQVISLLNHAGVNLDALDRQKLVETAAAQGSGARHSLKRRFVPGWDPNIRKGVWRHLEQRSNLSAKQLYVNEIAQTFVDIDLWRGDAQHLKNVQAAWLLNPSNFHARREMEQYQYQYLEASGETVTIYDADTGKSKQVKGEGNGGHMLEVGIARAESYRTRAETPTTTGDEKLGALSGGMLTVASLAQLSLSIATAVLNMTALPSHSATYLATHNSKTGYGGGHGIVAAGQALIQAGRDLSLFNDGLKLDRVGNVKGLTEIIKGGPLMLKRYGLTLDEAQMLLKKTDTGILTPNLSNALTGAGRFGRSSNTITDTISKMMFLFSKSEQYNRRVTALASFRLDKAKMEIGKDGLTDEQKKILYNRVDEAVEYSQGNYDKFNYPTIAHGPVLRYLYLYKLFQTITIEHLWSMARAERLMFIAFIAITAGVTGIPFAENFADLLDTLMEMFNIEWSGLELQIAEIATAAGLPSGLILNGAVNYYTGIKWSARAGYTNPFPGLGMAKADAEPMRVVKDIAGPVYSAWEGIFGSAAMIGRYGLEVIGLRPDATTLGDVAKSMPISAVKNLAKGVTYLIDGTIVNSRGQTIVQNVGVMEALLQMIGFGPASEARQYQANRLTGYTRALSTEHSAEVVSAYLKADSAGKARLLRDTEAANRRFGKDSPFYVDNLRRKAQRKAKSNALTASARNLKTLPKTLQALGERNMRSLGMDKAGMPVN